MLPQTLNSTATVLSLTKHENQKWRGRTVLLLTGKYKGRKAIIDVVIPDANYGLLFCCMVLRADGSGNVLNTDGESRSFRPLDHFILLED